MVNNHLLFKIRLWQEKFYTEIHFILDTKRLITFAYDEGNCDKETEIADRINEEFVLRYGYRKGKNITNPKDTYLHESDDKYY